MKNNNSQNNLSRPANNSSSQEKFGFDDSEENLNQEQKKRDENEFGFGDLFDDNNGTNSHQTLSDEELRRYKIQAERQKSIEQLQELYPQAVEEIGVQNMMDMSPVQYKECVENIAFSPSKTQQAPTYLVSNNNPQSQPKYPQGITLQDYSRNVAALDELNAAYNNLVTNQSDENIVEFAKVLEDFVIYGDKISEGRFLFKDDKNPKQQVVFSRLGDNVSLCYNSGDEIYELSINNINSQKPQISQIEKISIKEPNNPINSASNDENAFGFDEEYKEDCFLQAQPNPQSKALKFFENCTKCVKNVTTQKRQEQSSQGQAVSF